MNSLNTRMLVLFVILSGATLGIQSIFAQEWSPAQKEVWEVVEKRKTRVLNGDIQGMISNFVEDIHYWGPNGNLWDKDRHKVALEEWYSKNKVIDVEMNPVKIQLYGDAAVVHYTYSIRFEDADGEEKKVDEFVTTILIKQAGQWKKLGGCSDKSSSKTTKK